MFKRTRYQQGCVTRERRKSGPDVWIFRWRALNAEGKKVNRKAVIGTVMQYRTETAAQKAAESLRLTINHEAPQAATHPVSVEQLVEHYKARELSEGSKKAYSTMAVYKVYLSTWILPRWGSYRIQDVKTIVFEEWLQSLSLADGTKAKIRNLMSALFKHAMRHEWTEKNPISLVRQSAKRQHAPEVLSEGEIMSLLAELHEPYRTMVLVAASTGLRISELMALKWSDIDFELLQINLSRAVVHQVVGDLKTEASQKPIPVAPLIAEALLDWRKQSAYRQQGDWVFASPAKHGEQPYWPESLLRHYIRPAAQRCGIQKQIGWHTFRHSYATLLKANGEDVKVVQESLRHANSRTTLDIYTQAVTAAKRQAHGKVVSMILPARTEKLTEVGA